METSFGMNEGIPIAVCTIMLSFPESVDGSDWLQATLVLPPGTAQVTFIATKTVDDFRGDIALDDIKITSRREVTTKEPTPAPTPSPSTTADRQTTAISLSSTAETTVGSGKKYVFKLSQNLTNTMFHLSCVNP